MDEKRNEIFVKLRSACLTSAWMVHQLDRRGVTTNASEYSAIMSGSRRGPKAETVIEAAGVILADYERAWGA